MSNEVYADTTAWKSIPKFVRFATWLFAIGTVISAVVGLVLGAAAAAAMSS